ncbi:F0F1 ATP synthase subunit delta [Anaerobacillus sp. HL2]|nr:F0F1 ATP synthase subunit delta [Anaerobacillus sp. HL2]
MLEVYKRRARDCRSKSIYCKATFTDVEKVAFEAILSKASGKDKLTITNIVDPEIIGGFKVRIGDRIYDGSKY